MKKNSTYILFAMILILAFTFRIAGLSQRPMHGDEAINAFKLAELMETGIFEYDPQEYHGPLLYFFSLPLTYIFQLENLSQLNEIVLRFLPFLFFLGLFGLLLIIRKSLNKEALITSSFLLALSPAFVFYGGYYIHEMMFVFFSYAVIISGYKFLKNPTYLRSTFLGISLGLWMATKETWIIIFAAMLFSTAILSFHKTFRQTLFESLQKIKKRLWLTLVLFWTFTISIIFTSFFQYMQGVSDFFYSFVFYFDKAASSEQHIYPAYKYLSWLMNPFEAGLIGESLILILALAGGFSMVRAKKGNHFLNFLALFSLLTFIFYSLIPYKTPWNILTAWFGFVVVAGVGFSSLNKFFVKHKHRFLLYVIGTIFTIQLVYYSFLINYSNYNSPSNPYTFSQPQKQVLEIQSRFESMAAKLGNSYNHYIEVISPENDYWPLPWYLRKFTQVAWRNEVDFSSKSADIAIVNIDLENDYIKKLYEHPPPGKRDLYIPLFSKEISIRPGLEMNAYIKKSLWDSLQQESILELDGK